MQNNFLREILKSSKTVFSFKEIMLLFRRADSKNLKSQLTYYIKNGDLHHIRRGLYAKDIHYNRFELATKIFTPAYISFETVLNSAGIVFQYYSQIFIASYQSRTIVCDESRYVFRKLKSSILTNAKGIETLKEYSVASPERAFLDTIYLNKNYHFDNLGPLNWDNVYEILPIYGSNKSMKKRVDRYHDSFKATI